MAEEEALEVVSEGRGEQMIKLLKPEEGALMPEDLSKLIKTLRNWG